MDKIKPIENNEHLCWKCLQEYNNIHKFVFGDLGYGSRFDSFGSQIQLCDKCFEESNPKIWDFEEVDTENICGGHYKYENEIWEYINNLPIESQELFNNVYCFGSGTGWNMESQDWIDYKLGILSHDKCKEYGYYSLQEKQAYRERFPTCEYPVNITHEDGSHGCHCRVNTYTAFGEYGQTCDEYNISNECYECEYYKKRNTPIKEIKSIDEDDYWLYIRSKLKQDELKAKFE